MSRYRSRSAQHPRWLRYGLAVAAVAAALGLRLLFGDLLEGMVFSLFLVAVAGTAWWAGLGPALAATGLSILVAEYFLLAPPRAIELHRPTDLLALLAFGCIALLVSWASTAQREAKDALAVRGRELEQVAAELEARRTEAERARDRSRFLAEVSGVLTASLDYRESLQELARLVVTRMADYCVTYMVDEREIRRVGVAHADPQREELVRRLLDLQPPTSTDAHGAGAVIRTGERILARDIDEALLERATQGPEHRDLIRELGPTSSMIVPLRARGRIVGAIAFATTARSGRRYSEEDLLVAEELARQAALAVDNARLYERLQRSLALREEVLAVVAHDLRDPLGTIASATALLKRGPDAAERERLVEVLRRQLDRAERLIRDLLDVSRLEAGHLSLEAERVPLARLVEEACDAARLRSGDRAIRFRRDVDGEAMAVADRSRILQVLSNLLDNAVKATPDGGEVAVEVQKDDGGVRVAVRDQGPGIPDSEMPRLFERFWQGGSGAEGSAGLGLTIVKGIVEEHGGEVWVESREEGSTFFFRLPALTGGVAEG